MATRYTARQQVTTFSKHAASVTRVRRQVTVDVTAQSDDVMGNPFGHEMKSREHSQVDDVTARTDDVIENPY